MYSCVYGFWCQKVHFHCRANFFKIMQQYLEAMRRIVDRYCCARLEKLACKGNSDLLTPESYYVTFVKLFENHKERSHSPQNMIYYTQRQ